MSHVPTPAEVLAAREAAGLTQKQAAELVFMGHAKRWSEVERGVERLHPGLWELFCIKVGAHPEHRAKGRKAA